MARNISSVIVGYVAMAAFVFISFTVLYLVLGTEGSFQPNSYQVSLTWMVFSIILGFIAALIGGYICVLIAKNKKAALWLVGIVFVLGLILALPQLNVPEEEMNKIREGDVPNMEAMQNAKQPALALILNPFIGALGVWAGSRMWKPKA
jgi:H+/Cl- antiporter ClcA